MANIRFKSVKKHYDLLVEENNDPVYDCEALTRYMDKWDGQTFINAMRLKKSDSVLEIGVGTGRIAQKILPLTGKFTGVDISPKSIERAKENLKVYSPVLVCSDFLTFETEDKFDCIVSTLTFIHIKRKQKAIKKVSKLLAPQGRFVLSISKKPEKVLDYGSRKVKLYPDDKDKILRYLQVAGLNIESVDETEFSYIIVSVKNSL